MHKNAINMLEGVKKILLWRIFERNLAKFFCGAFLSTFWPNCGAFRRKIISHTALIFLVFNIVENAGRIRFDETTDNDLFIGQIVVQSSIS